jgi:hypothetical protein
MWVPKKTRPLLKADAALIDRGYEDLLLYDFPVLFTGMNRLNERVVGSLVENVKSFESYLHSIVDEKLFIGFLRREISYLELLDAFFAPLERGGNANGLSSQLRGHT